MGLIDQAARQKKNTVQALPPSKGKGLLEKIRRSSSYDTVMGACSRFVSGIAAERFLLLAPHDDRLAVATQLSLDLTTYRRFTPSSVFFSSQFPETSWYTLRGECLEPFFSFFSSRERDSLTAVYVRPAQVDDRRIYLVVIESLLDVRRKTIDTDQAEELVAELLSVLRENSKIIEALSQSGQINRDKAAIEARIDAALSDGKVCSLVSLDFSGLFSEARLLESDPASLSEYHAIINRIIRQSGPTNIVNISTDMMAHMALFLSSKADAAVFVRMLMKPLEALFGAHRISKIKCVRGGETNDKGAIRAYLRGET